MKKYKTMQELFRNAKRWTKGAYSRSSNHHQCRVDGRSVVSFCLYGGLDLIHSGDHIQAEMAIHKAISKLYPEFSCNIVEFNDAKTITIKDIQKVVKLANV